MGQQTHRSRTAHAPKEATTTAAASMSPAPAASTSAAATEHDNEVVFGRTPSGEVFAVPETHSWFHHLASPSSRKSSLDLLTLGSMGLQIVLFLILPLKVSRVLFVLLFAFFRLAYNVGLGWVLIRQSKSRWIVSEVLKRGWLDANKRPKVAAWCKRELEGKIGRGTYTFEETPKEFTIWLLFRQMVDVILLNDFVSYSLMAFSFCSLPAGHSVWWHLLRWVGGTSLILFNLWVKIDAHRVVKDYAWYWGDAFYQTILNKELVFDGVYNLAPHPMYSVGYAGFYGLSIIVASYTVLFVSIAAHAAQFGFLLWFENPHIDRIYGGGKKPLARRMSVSAVTAGLIDGSAGSSSNSSSGSAAASAGPLAPDMTPRYFKKDAVVFKNLDLFRSTDLALVLLVGYTFLGATVLNGLSARKALVAHFLHAIGWRLFHSFGLGSLLRKQSANRWLVRHFLKHYAYPAGEEGAVQDAFANWKATYNLSLCMTYASFIGLAWTTYSIPSDWTVGGQLLRHTLGCMLVALHLWTAASTYEVLGDFGWLYSDFFLPQKASQLAYTGIYRFLNNPERSMGGAAFFGLALVSGSKLVTSLAILSALSHWWFLSFVESPHMRQLYGDAIRKDAGITQTLKTVVEGSALLQRKEMKRVVSEVRGTFDKVDRKITHTVEEFLESARPKLSEVVEDTKFLLQQSRERLVITRVAKDLPDTTDYSIALVPSVADMNRSAEDTTISRFHIGEAIKIHWQAPVTHSKRDWIGIYRLDACKSTLVTRISSAGKWVPIHADQYDGEIPISDEDDDATGSTSASVASGTVTLKGNALPWNAGSYELRYHHDGKHNVMARLAPLEIFVPRPEDPMSLSSVQEILTRIVTLALDSDSSLVPQSSIATPQPVRTPTTAGGGSVSPMQAVRGPASTLSPVGGRAAPATIDGEALHAASEASAADDQADAHDPLRRALLTISSDNASTALTTDDPDDFTIMSAVQAERLVKGIRLAFDVDFTTAVVVAQPNVRELAERIVGSLKVLARDSGDGGSGGGAGPGTGQRPLGTRALSSGSASAVNGDSGGIGSRS